MIDAIRSLAEEARYDPVQEWLDGLEWDGTPRLKNWLSRIARAPSTSPFRAVGVRLILGMVARAQFPGSKFDLCLVLEGEQGCGKSSLARLLASGPGDTYFVDATGLIAMDNKTRGELLAGRWVAELAELSGHGAGGDRRCEGLPHENARTNTDLPTLQSPWIGHAGACSSPPPTPSRTCSMPPGTGASSRCPVVRSTSPPSRPNGINSSRRRAPF